MRNLNLGNKKLMRVILSIKFFKTTTNEHNWTHERWYFLIYISTHQNKDALANLFIKKGVFGNSH